MKVVHCKTYEEMSRVAADLVEAAIAAKPDLVLGLATGSTPEGFYAELVGDYRAGKVSFANVTTVNLDEYCRLPREHKESYFTFMHRNLFDHVDLDPSRTHLPDGNAPDLEREAQRYEKLVSDLGYADVQILGIGRNGHIGFNEPAAKILAATHVTALTEDTIRANSRFFASANEVPKQAITMGVGTIMAARRLILMASGESKRNAVANVLLGKEVDTMCPATLLKLHRDVVVICDDGAWPY